MAASPIKEPVRIRRKTLANGNASLYLAIYINGRSATNRQWHLPTPSRRIIEIQNGAWGFNGDFKEQTLFYEYYNALTEKRRKKESQGNFSNWASCLRHLKKYDPRNNLTFADITPKWIEGFKDYLENRAEAFGCDRRERKDKKPLSQNSRQSYFNKLRACLRQAYEDGIIRTNPIRGIVGFSTQEGTRDYLTLEEVKAMAADCDYPEIKRAFFSCLTGLRRSDIINIKLTWGEVTNLTDGPV